MAKQIQLPDGTIGSFPDSMPDAQISDVLRREFPVQDQSASPNQTGQLDAVVNPSAQVQVTDRIRRATGGQPGQDASQLQAVPQDGLLSAGAGDSPPTSPTPAEAQGITNLVSSVPPLKRRVASAFLAGKLEGEHGGAGGDITAALTAFNSNFGADKLNAGAVAAMDKNTSLQEALSVVGAYNKGLAEGAPISSFIGDLTGGTIFAVMGGAALKSAAATAPVAKGLFKELLASFDIKRGQLFRNIGRAAVGGGVFGAANQAVKGGSAGEGAVTGAVGGPVALALAGVLHISVPAVKAIIDKVSGISKKSIVEVSNLAAIRLISDISKTPVKDLAAYFRVVEEITGKPPTLAEMLDGNAQKVLLDLIEESNGASKIASKLSKEAKGAVGQDTAGLVQDITPGSKGVKEILREISSLEDILFGKARKHPVTFFQKDFINVIDNPELTLSRSVRIELGDLVQAAGKGGEVPEAGISVPGSIVEDIRKTINKSLAASPSSEKFSLKNDFLDIMERSPLLKEAVSQTRRAFTRLRGTEEGLKVVKAPLTTVEGSTRAGQTVLSETKVKALGGDVVDTPNRVAKPRDVVAGRAGRHFGAAMAIRNGVLENSKSLLEKLTADKGFVGKLSLFMRRGTLDKIVKVARVQLRALESFEALTPKKVGEKGIDLLRLLVDATVTALPFASPASRLLSSGRILRAFRKIGLGSPGEKRLEALSKILFSKKHTKEAVSIMRKMEISDANILDIYLVIGADLGLFGP